MEILEYNESFKEDVKDLLVELQEHLVEVDYMNLHILTPEYREMYGNFVVDYVYKSDGKIFLAVENGKAVGMVAGGIRKFSNLAQQCVDCSKRGLISDFVISKNYRGQKVGEKLLNKMEEFFKSVNCEYCELNVIAPNKNAERFYDNHNYKNKLITKIKKL